MNDKILDFLDILKDLEDIGKKLYLESPETWIEFCDKVGEQNLDEMVLFYATKFNYVSVLKYVSDNGIINLDSPSRNRHFSSIREHLLAVAKDYNNTESFNFLIGHVDAPKKEIKTENKKSDDISSSAKLENNPYLPVFICSHCNENVLESGYKVYEEVSFAFSQEKNKASEIGRSRDSRVFCNNCNNILADVTADVLESICSIHNCRKCGKDLTEIGINEKMKMKFNSNENKFNTKEKTYNCPSCDEELSKTQIKYFNL